MQLKMCLLFVIFMCLTYVAARQSGAYHDTSVLYHAMEVGKEDFPYPPQGINFDMCFTYVILICVLLNVLSFMCRQVLCCRCGLP
jgi:hypothetical protein